ncbi:MAG: type II secretion system protein [Candidatus Paceibacterota bacterium]|jgi:prepilin-type N-terminal cleavage/methylation domain-containing protein
MFSSTNKKNKKESKGFTLIEMMVAVSLFVIVAFMVTSMMLTMSAAYKKAQRIRLLIDNLNFSVQNLSLGLREGKDYSCSGEACSFKSMSSWLSDNSLSKPYVCYVRYSRDAGASSGIKRCEVDNQSSCAGSCSGDDIVSSDIDITDLIFLSTSPVSGHKRITLLIKGVAGKTDKERTEFIIQTSVSQRNDD